MGCAFCGAGDLNFAGNYGNAGGWITLMMYEMDGVGRDVFLDAGVSQSWRWIGCLCIGEC